MKNKYFNSEQGNISLIYFHNPTVVLPLQKDIYIVSYSNI